MAMPVTSQTKQLGHNARRWHTDLLRDFSHPILLELHDSARSVLHAAVIMENVVSDL